ncbi:uncharacterized protein LOC121770442 [Salvia splendens]|uniref:uncharacterized protein LOC121770442 n=1 Tax=Salvia splendens TaxID=180675 RepID=UPI001C266E58|nr:uncharacterized protein LOC121770442 [Salvia splendens]
MGFPEAWISLIERCIGTCWFSVLINGAPSGFFKSTRGLRQGDPISPALFVIAAEYLSRALDKLILGHKEMSFKAARHCMEISHLAYAEYIIIFTQAVASSIRRLRSCLEDYAEVSGQQIKLAKSSFYITEIHDEWAGSIHLEGGFTQGTFPFLYLGMPIYRGVKRTNMFMFLREKVASRISGWAHRHLSFGEGLLSLRVPWKRYLYTFSKPSNQQPVLSNRLINNWLDSSGDLQTKGRRHIGSDGTKSAFLSPREALASVSQRRSSEPSMSNYGGDLGNKIHFGRSI